MTDPIYVFGIPGAAIFISVLALVVAVIAGLRAKRPQD